MTENQARPTGPTPLTKPPEPPRAPKPPQPPEAPAPGGAPRAQRPRQSLGSSVSRAPEYRFARTLLRGLSRELVENAWAYRPLSRASLDGSFARRLPRWMVWAPHGVVVALALLVLAIGTTSGDDMYPYGDDGLLGLLDSALPAIAVLLTLVRPVAAFWCSLGATLVVDLYCAIWTYADDWPWLPGGLTGHLVVMTVVALRTGPRAAAGIWVVTAAYGIAASVLLDGGSGSTVMPVLSLSAVALLIVAVRQIRRTAQQEVTAERHISAAERSRRTLLEERTTIAHELHDVVAHHMSVVAIQAEAAPYRVADPPPELTQAFATIRENAVAALAELRRVLGVVRAEDYQAPDAPQPTLADLGALLANVRSAGLDVTLTVTGAVRELPQGVELSAYRIVQEALSNVLRHAPGAAAQVEVSHVLGGLGLRVVNGPPTEAAPPSPGTGHGVTGMRERVGMLGGGMTVAVTAEGGYEVVAFLPAPAGTDLGAAAAPPARPEAPPQPRQPGDGPFARPPAHPATPGGEGGLG